MSLDGARALGRDDVEAALIGGVLLSAGGSGRARVVRDRAFATQALERGEVRLTPIADLPDDARVLIATAVGAPGSGKHLANAEHSISAARRLLDVAGQAADGVMPGHVPGIYGWLLAAALKIPLLDAACNGRGHPTVNMGSLGLSSRPEVTLYQSGVGDQVAITVHGNTSVTSLLMRAAAVQNGGLLMAARGLLNAALVRDAGAIGAISAQIGLGRAVLQAQPSGRARIDAALHFLRGRSLAQGTVVANTVRYHGGFDVGTLTVRDDASGHQVALAVCNEFMAATIDGERVATFPDLLAVMDPVGGDVVAIGELPVGAPAAVIATSKRHLAMGSGIFDPSVYGDVEQAMGIEIARYALDPQA